ncbi:hypothetical protein B0H13DRAFT_1854782 [Mycena leptocephala]|nr:hypothetical protein B0H13DRAFT_1854782 [Mycena leptocephala]
MSSPAPRWSGNAAPMQLSVYNVNMRPLLPKAESLNHTPTLLELGIQLRRDSVSPICRGPDKTLKGKLSTAKPKAHRQDENASLPEQEALKANRRSTGQRERRQRELATEITALNVHGEVDQGSIRSRGQRLPRKLEAAKRCLEDDPNCDSTNALSKAINRCESSNPFRRRRDLPSYQERMLGRDEYLRMQAIAKEIDRERREREENTL